MDSKSKFSSYIKILFFSFLTEKSDKSLTAVKYNLHDLVSFSDDKKIKTAQIPSTDIKSSFNSHRNEVWLQHTGGQEQGLLFKETRLITKSNITKAGSKTNTSKSSKRSRLAHN